MLTEGLAENDIFLTAISDYIMESFLYVQHSSS